MLLFKSIQFFEDYARAFLYNAELCLYALTSYYAQNYASIIRQGLQLTILFHHVFADSPVIVLAVVLVLLLHGYTVFLNNNIHPQLIKMCFAFFSNTLVDMYMKLHKHVDFHALMCTYLFTCL